MGEISFVYFSFISSPCVLSDNKSAPQVRLELTSLNLANSYSIPLS